MLYFLSHPIHYFSPLFKMLSNKINLDVVYFSDVSIKGGKDLGFGQEIKWDIPLLDGYSFYFVNNWFKGKPVNNNFWDVFNPGVLKLLWKSNHKIIVVNGWTYSSNWLVFIFGRLLGKELWLRAESPLNQELRKGKMTLFVKSILLQHILFKFFIDKFLYIGTQNKAFYQYYGVCEESRFIHTPYAVDNDFFKNQAKDLKPFKLNLLKELSIPLEKKIILFSGKYINKKRPLDLLKAYSLLPQDLYVLVFVGDGHLRMDMEKYILNKELKNVILTGFINQSQISKYYAVADVFVMCSGIGETWGLSVNEAMNFGLPVVVSETCGSSYDLVESGINGYVFKEGNIQELSSAILNILESTFISAKMGQISENLIENFSNNETVKNISKIINLK